MFFRQDWRRFLVLTQHFILLDKSPARDAAQYMAGNRDGSDSGGTKPGAKAMDAVVKQRKSGSPSTWSIEAIAKRDWLSETIS